MPFRPLTAYSPNHGRDCSLNILGEGWPPFDKTLQVRVDLVTLGKCTGICTGRCRKRRFSLGFRGLFESCPRHSTPGSRICATQGFSFALAETIGIYPKLSQ